MRLIQYLGRNMTLLNILLLAGVVLFAVSLVFSVAHMNVKYTVPKPKVKTQKTEQQASKKPGGGQGEEQAEETEKTQQEAVQVAALDDYTVVGELNLFHPERKLLADKKAEVPKPDLFLYGTLITENMQLAFVEDKKNPRTSPGRGKRQSVIKRGDVVGGFTLTDIAPDMIVLTKGDEKLTFYLNDAGKKRGGEEVKTAAPATTATPSAKAPAKTTPAAKANAAARANAAAAAGERASRYAAPPLPRGVTLRGRGAATYAPGGR